jgi:hypothetical protein
MEAFADVLTEGGRSNSLGRAGEVVDAALADRGRLDELWACIGHDDPYVRMRAIDSFEKVVHEQPAWADGYVPRILEELTASSQASIQWHVAQLFSQVRLDDDQRVRAIAWLRARLATTDVDWIVSINCMRTLLNFRERGDVGTEVLRPLFEVQRGHPSKTVRRKADDFLADLD